MSPDVGLQNNVDNKSGRYLNKSPRKEVEDGHVMQRREPCVGRRAMEREAQEGGREEDLIWLDRVRVDIKDKKKKKYM